MSLNPKYVASLNDELLEAKAQECERMIIQHKGDEEIVLEYRDDLKQLRQEQQNRLGLPESQGVSQEDFDLLVTRVQVLEDICITLKGKVTKMEAK